MTTVRVSVFVPAPPEEVWADISDVASHVEWMADAESIRFLGDQTTGEGTSIEVLTKIGPLRTTDRMVFVTWDPPHVMGIHHRGLVTGEGQFTLSSEGAGTRFVWEEQLTFPWWLGGPITATCAAPILRAVWRRNLDRLVARFG